MPTLLSKSRSLLVCLIVLVWMARASAINVYVDYTYDTSQFFGTGNPQGGAAGVQAKAALEAAANYFSAILTDSFLAIQTPSPYPSSVSNGLVTWSWNESFTNPASGTMTSVIDATVQANQYVVYAGARGLGGATAGVGGSGGYNWSRTISGENTFSQSDIDNIHAISDSFENAVETRGQTSGFSRWGGSIAFDTSDRTWHFNHTTAPLASESDFYSVAIHELSHALGFGQVGSGTAWNVYVNAGNSTFIGPYARAANGGASVPLSTDLAHWAAGTTSTVYGSATSQEAAMDPDILNGTRKFFTTLDAAAMRDIGWELTTPPGVPGDYNNNGAVDAADYALWRHGGPLANEVASLGIVNSADFTAWRERFGNLAGSGMGFASGAVPEPAGAGMLVGGCWVLVRRWRRR
ncbi:MAG: hypothetical protein IT425_09000 [Pirellulales bacterium]|nr:hypothetical protein [Pirellulales bacterium]